MKALAVVGGVVVVVAVMVIGSIINGYTLSVLWGWFIVPALGAPSIGVIQAIGIAMVVGFLTKHAIREQEKKEFGEAIANAVSTSLIQAVVVLSIGWIVHLFL